MQHNVPHVDVDVAAGGHPPDVAAAGLRCEAPPQCWHLVGLACGAQWAFQTCCLSFEDKSLPGGAMALHSIQLGCAAWQGSLCWTGRFPLCRPQLHHRRPPLIAHSSRLPCLVSSGPSHAAYFPSNAVHEWAAKSAARSPAHRASYVLPLLARGGRRRLCWHRLQQTAWSAFTRGSASNASRWLVAITRSPFSQPSNGCVSVCCRVMHALLLHARNVLLCFVPPVSVSAARQAGGTPTWCHGVCALNVRCQGCVQAEARPGTVEPRCARLIRRQVDARAADLSADA